MKYIFFYATPEDIIPALLRLEANAPLKFVQIDILPNRNRAIYLKSSELPNAGIAEPFDGPACPTYMVSHRETKNHLYQIDAHDGRTLWALRNGDNERTVLLNLGGLSKSGAVIEGQMDTLHDTDAAQQLMRWFQSAIKRQDFVQVQGCWIGPCALAMLRAGRRLTQAEQAPADADIKWPGSAGP